MKWLLIAALLVFTHNTFAQGKGEKNQQKANREAAAPGKGNTKLRQNIPTQVRNAFQRDYPNATQVSWTKDRGNWTVQFQGPYMFRSVATYHSNGRRVDTQTPWRRQDTPGRVLDSVLRRFPRSRPGDIFKIERPGLPDLFRIGITLPDGNTRIITLDSSGRLQNQ